MNNIAFEPRRWETVRKNARAWWNGELERPLIEARQPGHDPGRPEPELPAYGFTAFYDLSVPAEEIVDRWDYDLSTVRYLGDAFPVVWPNFGAGVVAAFLGADLENDVEVGTCWFRPKRQLEPGDLHFEYDPDNKWLRRVKDVCRAAADRWQGLVQISMADLGGALDILSTFRPGSLLLMDLYDHPAEVERLVWEIHELWWRYFEEIDAVMRQSNPGYTAWSPNFSELPYYMLQCDFCYMIGPDMFRDFVLPELAASCRRLGNSFYHLDGPGQLPHLDHLLGLAELDGIQWIPGAGSPDQRHWADVYRRCLGAKKLLELSGRLDTGEIQSVVEQVGSGRGMVIRCRADDEGGLLEFMERCGVQA